MYREDEPPISDLQQLDPDWLAAILLWCVPRRRAVTAISLAKRNINKMRGVQNTTHARDLNLRVAVLRKLLRRSWVTARRRDALGQSWDSAVVTLRDIK